LVENQGTAWKRGDERRREPRYIAVTVPQDWWLCEERMKHEFVAHWNAELGEESGHETGT
jgi:hypothetical protein